MKKAIDKYSIDHCGANKLANTMSIEDGKAIGDKIGMRKSDKLDGIGDTITMSDGAEHYGVPDRSSCDKDDCKAETMPLATGDNSRVRVL